MFEQPLAQLSQLLLVADVIGVSISRSIPLYFFFLGLLAPLNTKIKY